jgi:sarcosine oxidase
MDEPSFYGFPEFGEPGWVKAAEDCGGREVTARTRTFTPDPVAEARLLGFVEAMLPGAATGDRRTATCLYALTPDRDFVLDAVPGVPALTVALGAAHGFKFAALFGEIMRDLALDRPVPHDLAPFALDRPALRTPDAPRRWLA